MPQGEIPAVYMDLLYCDESNLEERSGDFFLYGGVVICGEAARELSVAIDKLRADFKIAPDFSLKFLPPPAHLSHQDYITVKQTIVELAV